MHKLQFRPTEALFFRDGRPMGGANSGHGARFPEPHVLNSALHAACHRAFGDDPELGHSHYWRNRKNGGESKKRSERFGSLRTVGPFPVDQGGHWHFPRPSDLEDPGDGISCAPLTDASPDGSSNLGQGLRPIGNLQAPEKKDLPDWLDRTAFNAYLRGESIPPAACCGDERFFDAEHAIGIGIDRDTNTTRHGAFYSRAQLRFREHCGLAAYAETANNRKEDADILEQLFPESGRIYLGGEARTCEVELSSAAEFAELPRGPQIQGTRVKWVLLSPAIFPHLPESERRETEHPGGWLPSWIDPCDLSVQLLDGPGGKKAERLGLDPGRRIEAKLVAARIDRPAVITGWTNPGENTGRSEYGARSTLLAVPAGSVYYFEADSDEDARNLAAALNWHGGENRKTVNRRSALLGEKGFGIGVCADWTPFETIKQKQQAKR